MSATPGPNPPAPAAREPREARVSLRLRLWLACVSGGAVAGIASLWVLGTRVMPDPLNPADLLIWLSEVAIAGALLGLLMAMWLDHNIVGHLRGVLRGLESERVTDLRGLPGAGWGELSDLSEAVTRLIGQQRRAARAVADQEQLRSQLAQMRDAAERWARDEAWETPVLPAGPVEDVNEWVARAVSRRTAVDHQNRDVAAQVASELAAALADAQESATQAERGFVEATAMLTTVRELQRLTGELQSALETLAAAPPAPAAAPGAPAGTREVLESLVVASHESVEAISRAMLRVHDVAEQVQQMANRATLIAIHVVTGTRRDEGHGDDVAAELKLLARDVRETNERTAQFALEVEASVADATARMRDARTQAIERLEAPEAPPAAPAAPAPGTLARAHDDVQRLFERVREMVQDAARKGERLSQAGERASRAAERLARRIDEEAAESEALSVRLSPAPTPAPIVPVELRLYDPPLLPDEAQDENDATSPGEERP